MTDKSGWEAFRKRAKIPEKTMIGAETHKEYESALRELYDEFEPHGITEQDLVIRLASLRWDRNRLDRFGQLKMLDRRNEVASTNQRSDLVKKLKALAPAFLKAISVKEVEELLSKHSGVSAIILSIWPLEKCEDPQKWGTIIAEGIKSLADITRLDGPHDEYLTMVDRFPIVEYIDILEKFDGLIDRTLKRLMQLKTMKQMHRQLEPKLVGASKIAPTNGIVTI
jgi:hypothetical protein